MKNVRINSQRISALIGAIILVPTLTGCGFTQSKDNKDKETYVSEDSILNNEGIQYLVINGEDNQKIVPVEDIKLVNSKNEVIEKVDGVIVNNKIMSVENPVDIMFSADIEQVMIGYDLLPVSEFALVNGETKEKLTNVIGAYVNNEFIDLSNNSLLNGELLTEEKFYALVDEVFKKYNEQGLDINRENIIDYVMMVNIDKLARDNKELVDTIIGERNPDEAVSSAFNVYSAVITENNDRYCAKGLGWDSIIKVSDTVFDEAEREVVKKIEDRIAEIIKLKDNRVEFNEEFEKLLMDMLDAENEMFNMESGVGYSVATILVNFVRINFMNILDKINSDLVKYITYYEGDGIEYEENARSTGYYRNIFSLITECEKTKTLTR